MYGRHFSWLVLCAGACYLLLQASLGCLGGDGIRLKYSGPDKVNTYTCECRYEATELTLGDLGHAVTASDDDATEDAGGSVSVDEHRLMFEPGSAVGLRFRAIGIPRHAVIKEARIRFTAANGGPVLPLNVQIGVEDSTAPEAFSEVNSYDLSSRELITEDEEGEVVYWNRAASDAWEMDSPYETDDFAGLLQSIVNRNRDEWMVDENSSLVVMLLTNLGGHEAYAFDAQNGVETMPKLLVTYTSTVTAAVPVCLGETKLRDEAVQPMLDDCEGSEAEGPEAPRVVKTFARLVREAGYATDNPIRCEATDVASSATFTDSCDADCGEGTPLEEGTFNPTAYSECIDATTALCAEGGITPDLCFDLQLCDDHVTATHAGDDEPVCVAAALEPDDSVGEESEAGTSRKALVRSTSTGAIPLARQLFGQRSTCEVEGITYVEVGVDEDEDGVVDEYYLPVDGPPATQGTLTFLGRPCPDDTCLVGFASKLRMADIEFDVKFARNPLFQDLAQAAFTYPGVAYVGDDSPGVVADRSASAANSGRRGEERGAFFGTNDAASAEDDLLLTVNWRDKLCGLEGGVFRAVDAEGDPRHCEDEGITDRECDGDADCGVCVIGSGETESSGYCQGDGSSACDTDADCVGTCGDFPVEEGVLTTSAEYGGVLVNQPPTADASATQEEVECTSPGGAEVTLDGIRSSDPDHDISLVSWLKGGRLGGKVGERLLAKNQLALNVPTEYTLRVIDAFAQSDEATTEVVVLDRTSPEITAPADPIPHECTGYHGTSVDLGEPVVSDICDPNPVVGSNAPETGLFELGVTTVTWTATDADENSETDTQTVRVVDTTPPEISVSVMPDTLWPPNHKLANITPAIEVSDICDQEVTVTLVSIVSNEPDDNGGDGNTEADIQIVDDFNFALRAERRGKGSGRTYTVTYQAEDDSGNKTLESTIVRVPKSRKK